MVIPAVFGNKPLLLHVRGASESVWNRGITGVRHQRSYVAFELMDTLTRMCCGQAFFVDTVDEFEYELMLRHLHVHHPQS